MFQIQLLGLLEKLNVLRIRSRPATFDIIHTELIQAPRDSELVQAGKLESFALCPIAQSGVVDSNGFHKDPAGRGG